MSIDDSLNDLPPVVQRFLRYVTVDTQSDPTSDSVPSTEKQKDLGRILARELDEMGLPDVEMDEYGYVFATLPGNLPPPGDGHATVLGLLAHMDTAPDEPGAHVHPIVHPPYGGDVVALPGDPSVTLDPSRQPKLMEHIGERLITSDGTTLLGSDDKAGVAVLMQTAEDLLDDIGPRPEIRFCFTIDEEIGRGVDHLNMDRLACDVAYTLDGSGIDTISFETFNAAAATITVEGRSVHPGYAKDVLVNAVRILAHLVSELPDDEAPETTGDRQGYLHPHTLAAGDVSKASVEVIIRDFSAAGLEEKKDRLRGFVSRAQRENPGAVISIDIRDQYRNMKSYIEDADARTIEYAFSAAEKMGVELTEEIVRGGTDGARLSEQGLPTPNVFNGGYDYHSRFEWNTVENLERCLGYTKALIETWGSKLVGDTRDKP